MDGVAAYPDGTSNAVVVDLKTGNRIRLADVFEFNRPCRDGEEEQRRSKSKSLKEIKADPDNKDVDTNGFSSGKTFTVKDLNEFEVSDAGVTFVYDYGFRMWFRHSSPKAGSLSWRQLKPLSSPAACLQRFVR